MEEKTNKELYDRITEGFAKSQSDTNKLNQKIGLVVESASKSLLETNISIRLLESISSKLDNIDRRINSIETYIASSKPKIH